eukprot:CAMPEP_0197348152 /NCGR_PEP_ID=MMETSP0893-20130614/8126_1 /TAXON_ID=44058 ORGANISM="Aureoumbra lagunensis, Strain CCMP1510" /NCGR_SAMPLE_ID=MMETSP0893 /ASSEMBLY_ACC=CAM_ASM_000539 /LENGTH=39 /DNA_ID= /DNA_START= /DNA_END= /DNA_ORIENTATION=
MSGSVFSDLPWINMIIIRKKMSICSFMNNEIRLCIAYER